MAARQIVLWGVLALNAPLVLPAGVAHAAESADSARAQDAKSARGDKAERADKTDKDRADKDKADKDKADSGAADHFKPEQQSSKGAVTVNGRRLEYDAYAGTLVVHPRGWDDVPQNAPKDEDKSPQPEASMFYVAYFKTTDKTDATQSAPRPVTFIYNGGPGSSTVWLHMGAFGPRRVVTANDTHTPAAPYQLINNDFSLLDASDLVFIDAPGTGFSRIAGTDRNKAFYGVDPDAYAFSDFIVQFLSKYGRWNSPKYLFGESYGTTRSVVLVALLETDRAVDFNGVILLSQILNFDLSPDGPEVNPGIDLPYELALPTYAATAWYHHRLPEAPSELQSLLEPVEHFALGEYAQALAAGSTLPETQRDAIASRLHEYTGLPVEYIKKANLRISGGEFEKNLLDANDMTTGRLDTRFSGPTLDPLSKEAEYDPQAAAISSAYVSTFNDYVRKQLKYGDDKIFKPLIDIEREWNFQHHAPGAAEAFQQTTNVLPDLALALKFNPGLHVMLNGGYFDLATPFFEGIYEMQHLDIPQSLQSNIEYDYYQSGHMVYANEASLKQLHDKVADFIRRTQGAR
jgi:carboxypeptidase C (cathepsin A)